MEGPDATTVHTGTITRNGGWWYLGARGEQAVVADMRGMPMLRSLLAHPGRWRDVGTLDGDGDRHRIDAATRRAVTELVRDLETAQRDQDLGRVQLCRARLERVAESIVETPTTDERIRIRVTKSLRRAIAHVGDQAPRLGTHLERSIETGRRCAYLPTDETRWDTSAPPPPSGGADALQRRGPMWELRWRGRTATVRHLHGITLLAALMNRPGVPIAAVDLAALVDGHVGDARRVAAAACATTSQPMVDSRALSQYAARLHALRTRCADDTDEAQQLEDAIRSAHGLGGRRRRIAGSDERARVRMTKLLRTAITRIHDADPAFGRHLDAAVSTGTLCRYVGGDLAHLRCA